MEFYKKTRYQPRRIIFYRFGLICRTLYMFNYFLFCTAFYGFSLYFRDGVSEGQFNQVLLEEMDAIRKVNMLYFLYVITVGYQFEA